MHQEFVVFEGTGLEQTPCLRRRECFREGRLRLRQPVEGSAKQSWTQGQLQFINRILGQERVDQNSTTKQNQPEPASGGQTGERFAPTGRQLTTRLESRDTALAFRQQMAVERLLKEGPLQRKSRLTTDNERCRLGRAPLKLALMQQILITDQTAGVMSPQRASANQRCIAPGESFLKGATVTGATQLGSSASGWGKTTIEADSQHQTNYGALSR